MRKAVHTSIFGETIVALCDDGTIWIAKIGEEWVEMPAIPQSANRWLSDEEKAFRPKRGITD